MKMHKGLLALAALVLAACVCLSLVSNAEDAAPAYVTLESSYAKSGFVYSDEMLLTNACVLSPDLAKASVVLASAAYSKSAVNSLLSGMGYTLCGDYGSYAEIASLSVPDYDKVAYTIATKEYKGYIIYCVPVKGTGENTEWLSDFNLGDPAENDGYHAGFYAAAKPILQKLYALFSADGHSASTRIVWLTGHSRGAAVANLVAGRLQEDGVFVSEPHLFGYNFACPSVGVGKSGFRNIYNFNNAGDLIPLLPLQDAWGYSRYGRDYTLDMHERTSILDRFYSLNGRAYAGHGSDARWMDVLLSICASQDDYRLVRPCLDIVSYKFLGANKNVTSDQFKAYMRAEYADLVSVDTAITLGELLANIAEGNFYTAADNYIDILTALIAQLELPEAQQDKDYIDRLRRNINSAVNWLLGFEINTLESARRGVQAIRTLRGYSSVVEPVYKAVLNLFTDGGNPLDAVWDAHDWKTYELWINSQYCGYKAFAAAASPTVLAEADLTRGTVIGPYAFENCEHQVPAVPDNIRAIGAGTFRGCTGLTEITVPNSVIHVGSEAYYGCSGALSATLPVELVCRYVFSCSSLQTIRYTVQSDGVMPDRTIDSSSDILYYQSTLEYSARNTLASVSFDEGVTHIAALAYYNLEGREYDSYGRVVRYLGYPCLTAVSLPSTVQSIGVSAFCYDAALRDVDLPPALTALGTACFRETGIDRLAIPAGVTGIPENCFYGCKALTELEIPVTVETLGASAFMDCSGLREITLPVELSGFKIFGCPSLTSITYTARGDGAMPDRGRTIYDGEGLFRDSLEGSATDTLTLVTFSEGVTHVGGYAFYGLQSLQKVTLADTVTSLGRYAFFNSGLQEIKLPPLLETLSDSCFFGCKNLTEIDFPPLLEEIPDSCFRGCTGLQELTIPDTVTRLGNSAFAACDHVTSVTLPVTLKTTYAFGCPNVETIRYTAGEDGWMPDRSNGGGGYDYKNWLEYGARGNLTAVIFGEGVTRVGDYAFYTDEQQDGEYIGYPKLSSVTLPATLEKIGRRAFMYDSALSGVVFPADLYALYDQCFAFSGLSCGVFMGGLPNIGNGVFEGVTANMYYISARDGWQDADFDQYGEKLTWIALDMTSESDFTAPAGLRVIDEEAFAGTAFHVIALREGVEEIASRAFADCPALMILRLPASLTAIAPDAFDPGVLLILPPGSYAEEYAREHHPKYVAME